MTPEEVAEHDARLRGKLIRSIDGREIGIVVKIVTHQAFLDEKYQGRGYPADVGAAVIYLDSVDRETRTSWYHALFGRKHTGWETWEG